MVTKLRLPAKMSAVLTSLRLARFNRQQVALFLLVVAVLLIPEAAWASSEGGGKGLITAIGISIIAATVLAYLAHLTKQPLLLAYLVAGAAIGPQFGFGWVGSQADVRTITEIGLILLLFMIGLELNLKKLKEAGKSLVANGHFPVYSLRRYGPGLLHATGVHHRRAL